MRYIKALLILVSTILIFTLIVALFMPNKYYVERSILIDKSVDNVFLLVSDLNNYIKWDPWSNQEIHKKIKIYDKGNVQVYEWDGDTIGKGRLEITNIEFNKRIIYKLTFFEPWENVAFNEILIDSINGKTQVVWKMYGDLSYPIGRFMKNKIENMIAKDFDKGLLNLKKISENY